MKIESIRSLPADPARFERTRTVSEATAHSLTFRDSEVTKPQETFQKDSRSADMIRKAVETINTQLEIMNRSIQFSIDERSHDIVVKVVDKESGEVIRQVPPENVLRLREHMEKACGLIVEEEV
ncbi:MAG TPA: flagellar protein FlaG [Deltaproteobacteria bacterium]|nr:flagellar protein FlaG [Deltaproteobacteria bacterium]